MDSQYKNRRTAVSSPSMIPNEHGACALDSRPLSKGSEISLAGYISNGGTGYVHSPDFECCLSIKTISHNQNVANVLNANEHQRNSMQLRHVSYALARARLRAN